MRAIYRAVKNGRQVALLAPTTILAAQHYRTMLKRMPQNFKIGLLKGGNTRDVSAVCLFYNIAWSIDVCG